MKRALIFLLAMLPAGASQAALLTNFAESYALYQQATAQAADFTDNGHINGFDLMKWQQGLGLAGQLNNSNGDANGDGSINGVDMNLWSAQFGGGSGLPTSVCFKLYFDPVGITDGIVTAVVDVPQFGVGTVQIALNDQNGVIDLHPGYRAHVLQSTVTAQLGRERIETRIRFTALNPTSPPEGRITIFGYQIHDQLPAEGLAGAQAAFNFNPGDFITTFDTVGPVTTTFDHTQLQDTPLPIAKPLLGPNDSILAIDVDPLTSNSNYPPNESPREALDGVPFTQYSNFGKRNTGFIAAPLTPPEPVQSIVVTTSNGNPSGDPLSYQLYGSNDQLQSADNSTGMVENWTLIRSGLLEVPLARGVDTPAITIPNSQTYSLYRVVFPQLRDFRDASAMQVSDVKLFTTPDGSGPSIFTELDMRRAIQFPTPQADSPVGMGPEKLLDGISESRYLNRGKQNSGFIVTPGGGPTVVTAFEITTAGDSPESDPSSWMLYGTNAPIVSQDFSQGTAESWTLIDSGTMVLPNGRERVASVITVDNTAMTAYHSYRMVFPSMKNVTAPGVAGLQLAAIQLFGFAGSGLPGVPTPEPASIALLGWAFGLVVVAGRGRGVQRK